MTRRSLLGNGLAGIVAALTPKWLKKASPTTATPRVPPIKVFFDRDFDEWWFTAIVNGKDYGYRVSHAVMTITNAEALTKIVGGAFWGKEPEHVRHAGMQRFDAVFGREPSRAKWEDAVRAAIYRAGLDMRSAPEVEELSVTRDEIRNSPFNHAGVFNCDRPGPLEIMPCGVVTTDMEHRWPAEKHEKYPDRQTYVKVRL